MRGERARIVFFGTPEFAVPSLDALVESDEVAVVAAVTQPDRPRGRGKALGGSPVKERAIALGIPTLQPESIKKEFPSFLEALGSLGPLDGAVVVAFGQILPKGLLDFFEGRCINVHGSLLPRWRGAAPMQRALMAGDEKTGVGLMKMETGLDTGPVYCEVETPLDPSATFGELHDLLAKEGALLLRRSIGSILRGEISPTPQPEQGVTYAAKITGEETRIDWGEDARSLSNRIRGLSPIPGAFTYLGGKRLKLLFAREEPSSERVGVPGEALGMREGALLVACGHGVLAVTEAQLEGKGRMKMEDLVRGTPIPKGTILGPNPERREGGVLPGSAA